MYLLCFRIHSHLPSVVSQIQPWASTSSQLPSIWVRSACLLYCTHTVWLKFITSVFSLVCTEKYNFLGISIVGQSNDRGDGGIYIGSIMKGGAVAADGRIEPGDMLLQVDCSLEWHFLWIFISVCDQFSLVLTILGQFFFFFYFDSIKKTFQRGCCWNMRQ